MVNRRARADRFIRMGQQLQAAIARGAKVPPATMQFIAKQVTEDLAHEYNKGGETVDLSIERANNVSIAFGLLAAQEGLDTIKEAMLSLKGGR